MYLDYLSIRSDKLLVFVCHVAFLYFSVSSTLLYIQHFLLDLHHSIGPVYIWKVAIPLYDAQMGG